MKDKFVRYARKAAHLVAAVFIAVFTVAFVVMVLAINLVKNIYNVLERDYIRKRNNAT